MPSAARRPEEFSVRQGIAALAWVNWVFVCGGRQYRRGGPGAVPPVEGGPGCTGGAQGCDESGVVDSTA